MTPTFVHLRAHSEFSLVDGLLRFKPWMQHLKNAHMPAVGLTDDSNLFGVVKYYKAAIAAGIKPIIGADLWLDNSKKPSQPFRITVLCQNDIGYKHLRLLISQAYQTEQRQDKPIVTYRDIATYAEGLLILSSAGESDIAAALIDPKQYSLETLLSFWAQHFPNRFYLEIQRLGKPYETDYNPALIQLASSKGLPLVATNDVRFLRRADYEAHEARVCIHRGEMLMDTNRYSSYTEEQYIKSSEEMQILFADIPSSLVNTVEIAKRCNVELSLGASVLPNFPVPEGMTEGQYLAREAQEGWRQRMKAMTINLSTQQRNEYDQRLQIELSVINDMGFPGYFLIVADFIQWAKKNNIPVGPGRGSGAGSLVAYALGITDVDPLPYELLFERFLNPERVSMPDFDIDFCMDGRDRVIEYVAQKYGRQSVAQIITFGTMAAKAVVRDVGLCLVWAMVLWIKLPNLFPLNSG